MADKAASTTDPGDWTSTARSGWCLGGLHGWPDEDNRIEQGYCRLDSRKCGCGCHIGADVVRRTTWVPPSPIEDDDEPDDQEET